MFKSNHRSMANSSSRLFFLIMCIFMPVITGVVSAVLAINSISQSKAVYWNHMKSVSTVAAELIDGNELELITEEDAPELDEDGHRIAEGSERCRRMENILNTVRDAQQDMNIPYIYITRDVNGRQVFVVDPDLESPGAYGEEVVYTPAQPIAWSGTAMVDDEPYSDEWGTYYTAWAPVFNDSGAVVGLVGVDFEAVEINDQITFSTVFIIISAAILILITIAFFLVYSRKENFRMKIMSEEIDNLSVSLKTMFDEVEGIKTEVDSNGKDDYEGVDFLDYIQRKTLYMKKRLRDHMEYMEGLANVDFLTQAGNTRAFGLERDKCQKDIEIGKADFAVAVFDINNLKEINDNFGHESGDRIIIAAAEALKQSFVKFNVYRIGGDEFAVIIPSTTAKAMDLVFGLVDEKVLKINGQFTDFKLSVSKGYSLFDPETDKHFQDVFLRADHSMYVEKEAFHKDHPHSEI